MTLALDRGEVADRLEEIGLLLELAGENPFKTRAYHTGARELRALDRDFAAVVAAGELTTIKGIGKALAEKITELAESGELDYLDDLRGRVPTGLLDWLKIPGLGAKKARTIHVELGIATLGELEYACRENRLRDLPGFGARSQAKILEGIARVKSHAGRFLQPVVQGEARRLLEALRALPQVVRAEVGGSVRRHGETSKDIDIVAAVADPESAAAGVMDAFVAAAEHESIIGRGPTKCSLVLASGPSVDLRVVSDEAFPFALLYFTGSKAHNIALRARAQKRGLTLNEYALSEVACADEAEIYARLDLRYVEPELREDAGEIEAAENDTLPRLIELSDLQGAVHCHSTWSDGSATLEEMADACAARGLGYLAITDHSRAAAYAGGLDAGRLAEQHERIDALNAGRDDGFRILKGIEVDILVDGALDLDEATLERCELVIASVHSAFHLDREAQTERLLRALESPWVDALGHVSGRLLLGRDPYPLDLARVIERAIERRVAVELNAHPRRLDLDWRNLRGGLRRGLRTLIAPDAHSTEALDDVRYGIGIARKAWCTKEHALNALSAEAFVAEIESARRGRR